MAAGNFNIGVTLPDVQLLLDWKGEGMVVSCYADTSLAAGFQSFASQRFKNEVAEIERLLADDPEARRRFHEDAAIIRVALDRAPSEGTRGLAIFSAATRGLFIGFALTQPVKDRLVLDEAPYLVPLLEAMHRQRRYLVVLTDTHHGAVYSADWGRMHLLAEISETVPKRHRSAGEMWGKQQATIARSREERILRYLDALAQEIERTWREAPYRGLILLGAHETVEHLRSRLPALLQSQIVLQAPHSWKNDRAVLDDVVRGVVESAMESHDERLTEELDRRIREHALVASGPQEVVNALRSGQVGYPGYLVLQPDPGLAASRCTGCGSIFTVLTEACSYCQGRCETVNLWQEILLFAARHDIPAHFVDESPSLSACGGVAAVLSRAEPWPAASP
jgi:hypothetical protein